MLASCQQPEPQIPDVAWSKNNQGVGQMGSFDYDQAFETFNDLHQQYPAEKIFHQNWVIAVINRQQSGDEALAMEELTGLLANDQGNVVAHYLKGLLHFNQGDCATASQHFQTVVDADPNDAYASYFLGQCQLQQGNLEVAYQRFTKTTELDPYLRSAYYGAFMTAQRLNLADEAKGHLQDYQRMEMNPQSRLAEIKYTKMGPKASVQVKPMTTTEQPNAPLAALSDPFAAKQSWPNTPVHSPFTVVNQQRLELWVSAENEIQVYTLGANGPELSGQRPAPGITPDDLISITDINQDGMLDGYVTRPGSPDRIYVANEDDNWALLEAALAEGELPESKRVQVADLDHDGDLDVLTLDQNGMVHLLNNNNDMTFKDISHDLIKPANNGGFIASALLDLDGDRDLDVVLLAEQSMSIVLNDRMWYYQLREHPLPAPATQLAVNYGQAGEPLFHINTGNSIQVGHYDAFADKLKWQELSFDVDVAAFDLRDVNGDGTDDYLIHTAEQTQIINANDQTVLQALTHDVAPQNHWLVSGVQGPEFITQDATGINIWPASSNRHGFIRLQLSGRELAADSMRSNALGLGTELIVHRTHGVQKSLYLSQSRQANQHFDAANVVSFVPRGESGQIDFLELIWSDGVYQTELGLASGQSLVITETQRQLSSCPVLFMNIDGEFQFLTDVMGVGAMGFLVAKDQYGPPRDWEFLLLDQDKVERSDLSFLVTEPMEETMFLDALAMKVYEVDEHVHAVLDERLSIQSEQPSGELMFYQEQIMPLQVISQDGSDQTAANRTVDADPLPVGELDLRFLGHLKEPQVHTMLFDQELSGDWILMMHGWVEYGYSQTSFSAWQAGQKLQYPSLDAEIDGEWINLLDNWGFPAGMPKMSAIEFTIPAGKTATKLRIRSTQEVYIDQLSVAQRIYPEVTERALPLVFANQSVLGFPHRGNGPHRYPIYDFSRLQPFADTRHMTGAYTQLGPVEPLVTDKDNAIAIVSGGEAVTFQFEQTTQVVPKGKQRFYVMEFYGWAKDMDMLTEHDKYLLPLPHTGEISEQAKALNQQYNTRFMSGN